MMKPIISVLDSDIMAEVNTRSGTEATDSQTRKRGQEARQLKGSILNQSRLLQLAGLAEIYQLFGGIVNMLQVRK